MSWHSEALGGSGIAAVMGAFEGGGAQRDTVLLCNALAARGIDIGILVLRNEGPLRALLDPAVRVVDIGARHLRYALPALRRAIRAAAPAVVVSAEANYNVWTLVAARTLPRRHRPKIVLREAGAPSVAQYCDPYCQNRIAYRILRRLYRYADRIITLTDGARRDLAQNFSVPEAKLAVMRTNAVVPPATVQLLAQWDGESGREDDLIVALGRLSPEKDYRTLLRAVSLLPTGRRWRLAVVGEGSQRAALEACARANGVAERTIFAGYAADPFAWLMRARVAVCSSLYEGLGNAIIEALACGTPVVSTACPYGPQEILQGGRYGMLTPVGDAGALAAAIQTALDEAPDRRALMARGLHYTPAAAAERFLDIVSDLGPQRIGNTRPRVLARAS